MAISSIDGTGRATRAPSVAAVQEWVRKKVEGEALVAAWHEVSDATHEVVVEWPSRHTFYTEAGRYCPLLVAESIRQALALLSHTAHAIPLSHRLGWELIRCGINAEALQTSSEPVEVRLRITHTAVTRRRLGSVHLSARVEATRDGTDLATAELWYSAHPSAIYDRLRGRYADARKAFEGALPLTTAEAPFRVGRTAARDVVLTPTQSAHTWRLRVDTGHIVLFDHPHDHVPGMVLLEAVSQAAHARAMPRASVPVAFDVSFLRYVEFDQPCLVTAKPADPDVWGRERVSVNASQGGQRAFTATVTIEPATGHP
ncbi:ScbA/BarX family gamma-butyrolactone biosynthesis protein [Streptomyces sp. NPDC002851]